MLFIEKMKTSLGGAKLGTEEGGRLKKLGGSNFVI